MAINTPSISVIAADQIPFITLNEFRGGGSGHASSARGSLRGRGRRGGRGRGFTRNPGEIDAYSMDVAAMNIFKNQVIPMGLHNLSKNFKPNLATTRVFSLGTKFISVWKQMVIVKNLSLNSRIFVEECQIKSFLKKQHRELLF